MFAAVFCAGATIGSAQVADFSVGGGVSRFGDETLIDNPRITLSDGVRIAVRFALNNYQFFGHEFGYGYARSSAEVVGQGSLGLNIHSGFYNFLVYATPEGSKFRPFGTGGVHFSSFVPSGSSVYYGSTKFGFNYGGGLKVRVVGPWGVRFDIRQFSNGKPDLFQTPEGPSGWLRQTEISGGIMIAL
jgi:hypothetical protein